jgi:hypothetical protein
LARADRVPHGQDARVRGVEPYFLASSFETRQKCRSSQDEDGGLGNLRLLILRGIELPQMPHPAIAAGVVSPITTES